MTAEPADRREPAPEPPHSIAQSDAVSGDGAFRRPALALALMTITAGFADGFMLARYDVFVANQSGNLVRLGMAVADSFPHWPVALAAVVGFLVGGGVSWGLRRATRGQPARTAPVRLLAVLVLAVLAGALVALDAGRLPGAVTASASMGVLATVLTHIGSVPTQPSFQSANVVATAEGVLDWLFRADPQGRRGRTVAVIAATTVLCYVAGGALGAVAEKGAGAVAFLGLAPVAACLALVRRRSR